MSNYEYKTVALPRSVDKRRRRRQTEADLVAEQLGKTLNEEAVDGWEYVRAETLTTPGHRTLMKQGVPAAYVVLIFRRARESVWKSQAKQGLAPPTDPSPAPAAPTPPAPAPAPQASAQRTEPEVRFGSTSVQLVSNADGGSVTPLRPLGSAQD